MESIYTKLALYGSTNYCARTDNGFFPISEVCDDMVSLLHNNPVRKVPPTLLAGAKFIESVEQHFSM